MHKLSEQLIVPLAEPRLLAGHLKSTEGPAADADGNFYFVDIGNRRIHFWDVQTKKLSTICENYGGADSSSSMPRDSSGYARCMINVYR
jgi:sugar lactone lactonase YvrE